MHLQHGKEFNYPEEPDQPLDPPTEQCGVDLNFMAGDRKKIEQYRFSEIRDNAKHVRQQRWEELMKELEPKR